MFEGGPAAGEAAKWEIPSQMNRISALLHKC